MALPPLPSQGQDPWYATRTAWDNAVKAELEGRLSEAQLNATFGADAILNPETPVGDAVLQVAQSVTPTGVPYFFYPESLSDARPVTDQPVWWNIVSADPDAWPLNAIDGDAVIIRAPEPIPFSPLQVPGIYVWLDAVSLTLSDSDELAGWGNLVAGKPSAEPLTPGVGPTFAAAGINGGPAVAFNGVDGVLELGGFDPYAGPATVYLVASSTPATTTGTDFFYDGSTASIVTLQQGLGRNAAGDWVVYAGDNFTKTGSSTGPHLFKVEYGNPTSTLTVDGGSPTSGTTNDGPAITRLAIGGRGDGINVLDGFIGTYIYIRGTVTPETDALLVAYLEDRYGL